MLHYLIKKNTMFAKYWFISNLKSPVIKNEITHECEEIYYRQDNYVISVPEFPYFRIFLYRQKVRSYQRHFYNRRNWRRIRISLRRNRDKTSQRFIKTWRYRRFNYRWRSIRYPQERKCKSWYSDIRSGIDQCYKYIYRL